ncbi:MAG: SpoIID/LytB domain-containing protein [Planctomycetota bacterium]|nr:SpoIID/LytB domain-containing protein [Planctomycetota bacterium]
MAFCVAGLAGLLSCRSSHKSTETTVRELPTREAVAKATGATDIRVAVLKDAPAVHIAGGKARRILNAAGRVVQQPSDDAALDIRPAAGGLSLNGAAAGGESSLRIESASADEPLSVNGQQVARVLRIYCAPRSGALNVIAHLDLDEYLLGVLAGEVPFERWHPEALKAQAITSRSYAFNQMRRSSSEAYDVESTVMSQVFKAGYRNNPVLKAAVSATRGLVLTDNGAPFSAYFHSTCGGHTESGAHVFPEQPALRPLSGVPCSFCTQSPAYRWKLTLSKADLERRLKAASPSSPAGPILRVEFLDAAGTPVGAQVRAVQVRIHSSGGPWTMPGNQFRLAIGARDLKSLLFEQVTDTGAALEIAGAGFGHGVGLCQWGSQGMAQAGYSYAQILGKYYPGAELTRMY